MASVSTTGIVHSALELWFIISNSCRLLARPAAGRVDSAMGNIYGQYF